MQRRLIEAVLEHYAQPANNPVSGVYGGGGLGGGVSARPLTFVIHLAAVS